MAEASNDKYSVLLWLVDFDRPSRPPSQHALDRVSGRVVASKSSSREGLPTHWEDSFRQPSQLVILSWARGEPKRQVSSDPNLMRPRRGNWVHRIDTGANLSWMLKHLLNWVEPGEAATLVIHCRRTSPLWLSASNQYRGLDMTARLTYSHGNAHTRLSADFSTDQSPAWSFTQSTRISACVPQSPAPD